MEHWIIQTLHLHVLSKSNTSWLYYIWTVIKASYVAYYVVIGCLTLFQNGPFFAEITIFCKPLVKTAGFQNLVLLWNASKVELYPSDPVSIHANLMPHNCKNLQKEGNLWHAVYITRCLRICKRVQRASEKKIWKRRAAFY